MTSENKAKVMKLQMELSLLVKTHKIECQRLIDDKEAIRKQLQDTIDEQDKKIRQQQQQISVLNHTVEE